MKSVYLDNSATTKPYDEVVDCISHLLKNTYGNSSSVHKKGLNASNVIKDAKKDLCEILKCEESEIIFTSGGTESNNFAIRGILEANKGRGRKMVTTEYEHPSVLSTIKLLDDYELIDIKNNGVANWESIDKYIDDKTILASTMLVNSETGAHTDIKHCSEIVKNANRNCYYHVDAVQGFCKYEINTSELRNVDLLSISGHKIHGPKGIGALYIRKGTNIKPIITGGSHQNNLRGGTENTPYIAGFALAAQITYRNMKNNFKLVSKLNRYARDLINEKIEDVIINSNIDGSPYVLNIALKGIRSEVMLNHLSSMGIYISAGSACSSKKKTNSHVLEAMKVPKEYIEGAMRLSFCSENTEEDINKFVLEVNKILPMLRKIRRK